MDKIEEEVNTYNNFATSYHVGLVAQVLRFMKSFCLSAIPSSHLASSSECWGWKLWNQPTGHIPKCVPQSWPRKPTICLFLDHIPSKDFWALCHICLSQEWLWCSNADLATVICCNQYVCGKGNLQWRRHWCYERWNTEFPANFGYHFCCFWDINYEGKEKVGEGLTQKT